MLVSTGFINNTSSLSVRIMKIRAVWKPSCAVSLTSAIQLFNGSNGQGWAESADSPITRAEFGRPYKVNKLVIKPHYGGGWFASVDLQIPRSCTAETLGFDFEYVTGGNVGWQFISEVNRFIPNAKERLRASID